MLLQIRYVSIASRIVSYYDLLVMDSEWANQEKIVLTTFYGWTYALLRSKAFSFYS